MNKEKLFNTSESKKEKVIESARYHVPRLLCWLALTEDTYPRCCRQACSVLGRQMKEETGINLKMCRGQVDLVSQGGRCSYHAWLEYGDLVIDPTDFQFNVIDENELAFTPENVLPDNLEYIASLGEEERQAVLVDTWLKNAFKRYQENPNEKEKYFLHLMIH